MSYSLDLIVLQPVPVLETTIPYGEYSKVFRYAIGVENFPEYIHGKTTEEMLPVITAAMEKMRTMTKQDMKDHGFYQEQVNWAVDLLSSLWSACMRNPDSYFECG